MFTYTSIYICCMNLYTDIDMQVCCYRETYKQKASAEESPMRNSEQKDACIPISVCNSASISLKLSITPFLLLLLYMHHTNQHVCSAVRRSTNSYWWRWRDKAKNYGWRSAKEKCHLNFLIHCGVKHSWLPCQDFSSASCMSACTCIHTCSIQQ